MAYRGRKEAKNNRVLCQDRQVPITIRALNGPQGHGELGSSYMIFL